jgi:hypothetical protein
LTGAGFNVKITVFKGKVFQPFFASGFGLAWLTVRDGSFSGASPVTFGNASFFGGAGDLLSVGLDIFISQKVSFFTSLSYSIFGFWSVKGISRTSYEIKFGDKTLNVSYPKIAVGIVFTVFQIRD